jgi:hypothetical protein
MQACTCVSAQPVAHTRSPCLTMLCGLLQGQQGEELVVNGTISSPNCGVTLGLNATTTHIEAYYAKAVNYTVMITVLAFAQVGLGCVHGRGRGREGNHCKRSGHCCWHLVCYCPLSCT